MKLTLEQFADLLIEKSNNKNYTANLAEQFTIDFAADERNGEPCEWHYVSRLTSQKTETDCLLFDIYGGGEAFVVNITDNYYGYDKDEIVRQLKAHDIYEIYAYEEI